MGDDITWAGGDFRTGLYQRNGLAGRAIPDGHIVTGAQQPFGHRQSHQAEAEVTELLFAAR
jgi:hypothetical protein